MTSIEEHTQQIDIPHQVIGLDHLVTPVWIYDTTQFRIYWANKKALSLWGSESLDELCSRNFEPETSDAVHQTLLSYLESFERGDAVSRWWRLSPNGVVKDVFCQFSGIRLADGRMAMLCEGLEMGVYQSEAFMSSAMIASMYGEQLQLMSANPTFKEMFGNQVKHLSDVLSDAVDIDLLRSSLEETKEITKDVLVATLMGERWHNIHLRRVSYQERGVCFLLTQQDIHQRKERELKHAQQAMTDALTGLPNRYAFEQRMARFIEKNTPFTLFYIDLDGFKPINDTYGHGVGDIILRGVADRLMRDVSDDVIVCRIGGDEFVITARTHDLKHSPEHVALSVIRVLSQPFDVKEGLSLSVSASVGIAHYPDHGAGYESVLSCADAAMYIAKQRGRRRYEHYTPGMEKDLQRKMLLAQALPLAIERSELRVHYQPIINTSTGDVEIVEGLVRWHSRMLGEVSAQEAIEAAEDIGLIAMIETWVVNRLCGDLPRIRSALGSQVKMSINISGLHLMESGFLSMLNAAVTRAGLMPADIILELTEGTLIPVVSQHDSPVNKLKKMGYQIAIDDFGTGYSSLAYLHSFPVSYVKIDKAFVERMLESSATVACINRLVATLGMVTIAEGVEQDRQLKLLGKQGVYLQQGYWFAKPMVLDELMSCLAQKKCSNSWLS